MKILGKDQNWRCIFNLNIVNLTAGIMKTGGAIYFVTWYMHRPELVSILLSIILLAKLIGSMCTTLLYGKMDRVLAYKIAMSTQAIVMIGLFFLPSQQVIIIFIVIGIIHFINSSATPLQWSLLSDIIDDLESKSDKSLSGMVFSTNVFAIKIGIAIGGALIGWLLTFGGYIGNAPMQTEDAEMAIRIIFTIIPALLILSLTFILRKYRIKTGTVSLADNFN